MIELLKRWSELEPELCQSTYMDDRFLVKSDDVCHVVVAVETNPLEFAWLQRAIQCAIETRGWSWEIESYRTNKGMRYQARIVKAYRKYQVAQSAAESLLSAYIKALEVV